jgi:hypothetical protein
MRSNRGNPFAHLRVWIVLILFASIFVATGTAEIVAPGDILPVDVSGLPGSDSNAVLVNVPILDAILWNFFIQPIINAIPILTPSAPHVVNPGDVLVNVPPCPICA